MPKPSVAIRLGVEGQAELKKAFDDAGKSGQEAFQGVAAEMDKAGREAERLAARVRKAGEDSVKNALGGTRRPSNDDARAQREVEARVAALRSSIDPVGSARTKTNETIASTNDLLARGAITATEHARAIHLANEQLEEFAKKNAHAAGSGNLNRNQILESTHIVRGFIDQVAAGAEPLQALEVQAARIVQVFAEGKGGVAGTLAGFGSLLASVLTPTRLLIGATATLGITAVLAYSQFENAQDRVARAIEGTGRAAGLTIAQVNALGKAGAAAGGIGAPAGTDLAAGFVKQGITGDVAQSLVGQSKAFQRATGADSLSDAGETLAKAFADPAKGAADLDKSLGFLDDSLQTTLNNLEAQGRLDEARRVLSDAVNKALADTTDRTSAFGKALDATKNYLSSFLPNLGKGIASLVDGPTDQEKLKQLQNERTNLPAPNTGLLATIFGPGVSKGGPAEARLDAQIKALQDKIGADANTNGAAAAAAKRSADAQALSNQVGPLVRSILPEIARTQDTANSLSLLRQAIADPEVQKGLGVTSGQLQQAYGNTLTKSQYADPLKAMADDAELAEKAVRDYTIAERIETATRREALQVLRQTGDTVKANAAAEIARNAIINKANDDAQNRADLSAQNLRNASLSPYQAGRQAIIDKYEGVGGFDKDEATKRDLANSFKPASDLITSAGEAFKKAVQEAADSFKAQAPQAQAGGASLGTFDPNQGNATAAQIAAAKAFIARGYSPGAAAGFIGATTTESGASLNPNAVNPTSGATGIFQHLGSRKQALLASGDLSFGGQIAFGLNELDTNEAAAGRRLRAGSSVADGVAASDAFERPGDKVAQARRALALSRGNSILSALGGDTGGIAPAGLTTGASNATAKRNDLAAYDIGQITKPLQQANQEIDAQNALLKVQQDNLGRSSSELKGAAAAQDLLNKFISAGVPITDDLTAKTTAYGNRVADLAKRTEDFQKQQQDLVGALDGVRGAAREGLGTFVDDLRNGASLGKSLTDVFAGLENKLISFAEDQAIKGLFGATGTTQGGASGLGGILSGLFSGFGGAGFSGIGGIGHNAAGSYDYGGGITEVGERGPELVNLPAHSRIVPNQIAFGAGASVRQAAPQVTVYNTAPGATATASVDQGPSGQHRIRVMVDDAVMANAASNSRGTRFLARRAGV